MRNADGDVSRPTGFVIALGFLGSGQFLVALAVIFGGWDENSG